MGEAYLFGTGGGGGGKTFAVIDVEYPVGSVCTCTKGSKTLRAKDTSGHFPFLIPEAGTWTVSCTNGTNTATASVVIATQYQVESVLLGYSLIIYDAGTFMSGKSADCRDDNDGVSEVVLGSSYMTWTCGSNAYCKFFIKPAGDYTAYNTLNISVTNASMTIDTDDAGKGKFGLISSNSATGTNFAAVTYFSKFSGSKTLTIDISNVTATSLFIAMHFGTPVGGSFNCRVKKIWLE